VLETVDLAGLRTAGDWAVYVEVLRRGDLAFIPRPLNGHRRHAHSVVATGLGLSHLQEIMTMQARIAEGSAVPGPVRQSALAYDERLYEQFGLGVAADLRETPELAGLAQRIYPVGDGTRTE
jgi:hypothetical protein